MRVALGRYQMSLNHARRAQELRCTADALAGVAGILGMSNQTNIAAWLFGATEAYADRSGISFLDDTWGWQRDLGLPPSWQEHITHSMPVDTPGSMGYRQGLSAPPPVPDPAPLTVQKFIVKVPKLLAILSLALLWKVQFSTSTSPLRSTTRPGMPSDSPYTSR